MLIWLNQGCNDDWRGPADWQGSCQVDVEASWPWRWSTYNYKYKKKQIPLQIYIQIQIQIQMPACRMTTQLSSRRTGKLIVADWLDQRRERESFRLVAVTVLVPLLPLLSDLVWICKFVFVFVLLSPYFVIFASIIYNIMIEAQLDETALLSWSPWHFFLRDPSVLTLFQCIEGIFFYLAFLLKKQTTNSFPIFRGCRLCLRW